MAEILPLLISIALIAACGVFVAAEFALITASRSTIERLAALGDKKAMNVLYGQKSLSMQLSGAQVGITITNLAIGFLAEPAISVIIREPMLIVGIPEATIPGLSVVIGITIATVVTMVFGELIPKNLALARPIATAKFVERPQRLFTHFMKYPIQFLNNSANIILRKFGVTPQEELASARSADELLSLVRRSAKTGTLAKDTATMLERSLEFGEYAAVDVMTPRVRIKAIGASAPVSEILDLAKDTGLSRFPVMGKDLDDIVGVVHIKHAFGVERSKRKATKVHEIMQAPIIVPSSIQMEPLLSALRRGGLQMAIVIDEFGGTDGIVSIEDLLEELVGEVKDEHDHTKRPINKRGNNRWALSGLLRIDEIAEELNIFLPEHEDFDTIAGLVTDRLGHIPDKGEKVFVDAALRDGHKQSVQLRVERMDGRRIDRLEMTLLDHDHESDMKDKS